MNANVRMLTNGEDISVKLASLPLFRRMPKCIIVEGARNSGKSELISGILSARPSIYAHVKFRKFDFNITHRSFAGYNSILRQEFLFQFLDSMPSMSPIPIFDRMITTDIVMSEATKRPHRLNDLRELDRMWSRIAFQVFLDCPYTVRMTRADKPSEGNGRIIDSLFKEAIEATTIRTVTIDASQPSNLVVDQVLALLDVMQKEKEERQ